MNGNNVQSFHADTALSAHLLVKKTATGVALAGVSDKVIGSTLQDVATTKPTADVALINGYPTHDLTTGSETDIAEGDEVEQGASGTIVKYASGTKVGVALKAALTTGEIIPVLVY